MDSKKRSVCASCNYPSRTCICDYLSHVELPARIIVLQHKAEAKHAKNTVRLVKLIAPEIVVLQSGADMKIDEVDLSNRNVVVIYPSEHSLSLEQYSNKSNMQSVDTLVFIDASWRQAYGMWQANVWLHRYPQFHFESAPQAIYNIRLAKREHQLSTLEAIAYSLETLYGYPSTPFKRALKGLKKNWIKFAKP